MNVASNTYEMLDPPHRFEAGTPDVSAMVGLVSAIEWLNAIGWAEIQNQENVLTTYLSNALSAQSSIRLLCDCPDIPLFSFVMKGIHPHDVGTMCDMAGIQLRTGQHCAQPIHDVMDVDASSRVSLSFLNTIEECASLISVLSEISIEFGAQ